MNLSNNQLSDLDDFTNNPASSTSPTNILWNENEETLLQHLFANTLLNDDFSKKPDFDLGLGFDNLQLNYDTANQLTSDTNTQNTLTEDLKLTNSNSPLIIEHFLSNSDLNLLDINETLTSNSLTDDDKLFKRPSNDFIAANSIFLKPQKVPFKGRNKSDLSPKKNVNEKIKKCKEINSNGSETSSILLEDPSQILAINKLKRSRKRTKLILNSQLSAQNQDVPAKSSNKQLKQTSSKIILKNNKQNLIKLSNFEPLSKKFAPSLNPSPNSHFGKTTAISTNDQQSHINNNSTLEKKIFILNDPTAKTTIPNKNTNSLLLLKRDEFDLHIRELSLLDLHSSEDDSSTDFTKKNTSHLSLKQNNNPDVLPQQEPISLNIQNQDEESNEHLQNSNLSEIISKRVKYTPINSNNFHNDQNENESDKHAPKVPKVIETDANSTDRLDKFIQYFRSLDSPSSKEPVELRSPKKSKDSSKKSLESHLSPPSPSNPQKTQNKRKKKDTQSENSQNKPQTQNNQHPIILISLTPEKDKQAEVEIPTQNFQRPANLENDTLQNMKNLDINNTDTGVSLNLNDKNSRNYLWNLLKNHSSKEEMMEHFGSALHDKISFWDLVQLKLKYSKVNHLKTTYEIIDDYTLLYSNMSALLERFVNEQSNFSLIGSSKKIGDNSSRSRSSSRNYRKQSTSSSNR